MSLLLEVGQVEFVLSREDDSRMNFDSYSIQQKQIIPADWVLMDSSICDETMELLNFQNGRCILNQRQLLAFLETTSGKNISDMTMPIVVYQYLKNYPEELYQAFDVNIEGYCAFPSQEAAKNHLLQTTSKAELQHESDHNLIQTVLGFTYSFDRGVLALTARNTEIALSEQDSLSIIKFSANFHHDLSQFSKEECPKMLNYLVDDWETDFNIYKEIVHSKFIRDQAEQFSR